MAHKSTKQQQEFARICTYYHNGFSKAEIEKHLGKRVPKAYIEQALKWEKEQAMRLDEKLTLHNARSQIRQLKKQANLLLQQNSRALQPNYNTCITLIRQISELVEAEVEYTNRIKTLAATESEGSRSLLEIFAGFNAESTQETTKTEENDEK